MQTICGGAIFFCKLPDEQVPNHKESLYVWAWITYDNPMN